MGSNKIIYKEIHCHYSCIEIFLIKKDRDPIHVSFSDHSHQQAIIKLKRFVPKATFDSEKLFSGQCLELLLELLSKKGGQGPDFDRNPFLSNASAFQKSVWQLIREIPAGKVRTYGELAIAVGSPRGARAIGQACTANPLPLIIPCHRVTSAKGLGGFAGGLGVKMKLLELDEKVANI